MPVAGLVMSHLSTFFATSPGSASSISWPTVDLPLTSRNLVCESGFSTCGQVISVILQVSRIPSLSVSVQSTSAWPLLPFSSSFTLQIPVFSSHTISSLGLPSSSVNVGGYLTLSPSSHSSPSHFVSIVSGSLTFSGSS